MRMKGRVTDEEIDIVVGKSNIELQLERKKRRYRHVDVSKMRRWIECDGATKVREFISSWQSIEFYIQHNQKQKIYVQKQNHVQTK